LVGWVLETENIGWMSWFLGLLTLFGLPILDYPTLASNLHHHCNVMIYRC